MILSALILHVDLTRMRILYALTFCTGLVALILGFRRSRKSTQILNSPEPKPNFDSHQPAPTNSAESAYSPPQLIRLSLPLVDTPSTEMSQQQKVAAALIKAGITNPAAWTDAPQPEDAVAAALPTESATHQITSGVPNQVSKTRTLKSKLLLTFGTLLALASLFLLLRLH